MAVPKADTAATAAAGDLHRAWTLARHTTAMAAVTRRSFLPLIAAALAAPVAPVGQVAAADAGRALVAAARRQIGVTTGYDSAYRPIAYPGGDMPRTTGVCADVPVRAARDAWGVDLQRLVHEDMLRAFGVYPHRWGLSAPDPNIDHRRVPNLETFWTRRGAALWRRGSPGAFARDLRPGDILTWRCFPSNGPHVGVISHAGLFPQVIHNRGGGVREDLLLAFSLDQPEGHFRWSPGR